MILQISPTIYNNFSVKTHLQRFEGYMDEHVSFSLHVKMLSFIAFLPRGKKKKKNLLMLQGQAPSLMRNYVMKT